MTITLPAIDLHRVPEIATLLQIAVQKESNAIDNIRSLYGDAAALGGYIKLTHATMADRSDVEDYHLTDGERTKAFLIVDGFREIRNREGGVFAGKRLYLAAGGRWIETERCGRWISASAPGDRSRSFRAWSCVKTAGNPYRIDFAAPHGVRELSAEDVARTFPLPSILAGLSASIAKLADRLRTDYATAHQRIELADEAQKAFRRTR